MVVAAFFFGTTFVMVKHALRDVRPLPFLGVRFCLAAAVLWPFAARRPDGAGEGRRGLVRSGAVCGLALLAGYVLQTVGLQYTSASASAFITYLLVVFVPLISAAALRRVPERTTVAGAVVALGGLFALSGGRLGVGRGELLTLGCALAFAVHIVLLADRAPRHDPLRLNVVQLAVVGVGCLVPGLFTGGWGFTVRALAAAVYTAVAASAVAFSLMVWAQQRVNPSRTAVLLLLEPVFAATAGYLAGERLGWLGVGGAVLILAGVVLSEWGPGVLAVTEPRAAPDTA